MQTLLDLSNYSLVSAPSSLPEPAYSFAVSGFSGCAVDAFIQAVAALPGVETQPSAGSDWSDWRATWRVSERVVEFRGVTVNDDPPIWSDDERPLVIWVDCELGGQLAVTEVVELLTLLRRSCPDLWLHSTDCRLYSPESITELQDSPRPPRTPR